MDGGQSKRAIASHTALSLSILTGRGEESERGLLLKRTFENLSYLSLAIILQFIKRTASLALLRCGSIANLSRLISSTHLIKKLSLEASCPRGASAGTRSANNSHLFDHNNKENQQKVIPTCSQTGPKIKGLSIKTRGYTFREDMSACLN